MSKISYIGTVEAGKLILTKPVRSQMLSDLKKYEGKRVEVEIKKLARRSNPQNAYYWGVVVDMIKCRLRDLGHDISAEDAHHFLKDKFNAKDVISQDGELIGKIGGSTSDMNKSEFMNYLAAIQQFAAQYLDITIPDPETQTKLFQNAA